MVTAPFPLLRLPVRLSLLRHKTTRVLCNPSFSRPICTLPTTGRATIDDDDAAAMLRRNGKFAESEELVARHLKQEAKEHPRFAKKLKSTPSSSPPCSSGNANIRDCFKMGSAAQTKGGIEVLSKPLLPRAANSQSLPPTAPRLGSICGANSDPFKDEVHGMGWNRENHPSIEQDMQWLADESDIELEMEAATGTSATLPPPPKPQPAKAAQPVQQLQPAFPGVRSRALQSSQGTAISWSSSPPSHKEPPTVSRSSSIQSIGSDKSVKRKLDDNYLQRPAPKRKNLPFKREVVELTDDDNGPPANAAKTPAPKTRYNPLEASASAVKEQRRNHRLQHVQSAESDTQESKYKSSSVTALAGKNGKDLTMDEIQSIAGGPKPTEPIFLSSEQQQVLDLVTKKGQSVFFTGPAGTGKSVLMRSIIAELKKNYAKDPERVAVTASTGLAACNISGITLHSFAGIGLGKEEAPDLIRKIRRNPKAKNRWLKTRVLIIDEISMVDGDLFDKLSQIGRTIRNNGRPWGGIQLVITGDFFQLPPVPDQARASKFAFEASTWNTSIDHTIGLTQVFRQKDPEFAQMLNEMRVGKISDKTTRMFQSLSRNLMFDDGIDTTELFPTRGEVERANNSRLQALPGRAYRFDAVDSGDPKVKDRLLANMMAPKSIELKVGAQVMLIKNIDDQLVNGSIGKIKSFETQHEWEAAGGVGDGYGSGDELMDLATAKRKVKKFANPDNAKASQAYPIVEFLCTDGSHRTMQMMTDEWKVELPNGEVQATRTQLPLILSWALSIHKAQGQTLERVKVDLGKVFEKGQAYVALSRATTQTGLQVLKFHKSKVMAHPRVCSFYDKLYSVEQALGMKAAPIAKIPAIHGMFARGSGAGKPLLHQDGLAAAAQQAISAEDRKVLESISF